MQRLTVDLNFMQPRPVTLFIEDIEYGRPYRSKGNNSNSKIENRKLKIENQNLKLRLRLASISISTLIMKVLLNNNMN